ncbi:hypothetical protein FRC09_007513 [Ceratobasidium sp. 395]|nr:hypothetical protein FRC09_007513 [Ceratobasidium sp. 395]
MNSRPSAPSRLQLGVVHRAAKAHDIAALSNFYDQGESLNLRDRKWHETASQKRTIFVFRYGPENWMVARGLISPKVQTLQNVKPPTEKHASPERNAIEIAIEPEDVKPRITPPLANAIVKHEPSSNANTDQFSSKSPDAEQTVPTQIEVMDLCDSDSEPEDIKPQVTPPPANVTIKQEPSSAGNDQSDLDKIAGIVGQLAQEFGQMRDGIAQTNAGLRQMNENIAGLVQVLERKA